VEISGNARKHGVTDDDMLHAVRVPFRLVDLSGDRVLYIGADRAGTLLEVIVADVETNVPCIIHAMRLRPKFYDYL
jgi:hypothetical protein